MGASGSLACLRCPEHSTSPEGAILITQCDCLDGFVLGDGVDGNRTCECDVGYEIVSTGGGQACDQCERGLYKPSKGNTKCIDCPLASSTTENRQASSVDDCKCDIGFYLAPSIDSQGGGNSSTSMSCVACETADLLGERGTDCTEIGESLELLPVRPGFYRRTITSRVVRKCPSVLTCLGGRNLSQQCAASQDPSGPYCTVCNDDYIDVPDPELPCELCGGSVGLAAFAVFGPLLGGIALVIVSARKYGNIYRNAILGECVSACH